MVATGLPLDRLATLRRLSLLGRLLDEAFHVPILKRKIGLDAIIGLLPGIGDVMSTGVSLYIVAEAARLGAPRLLLTRMIANVLVDTSIGIVPVVGDVFDALFRANVMNLKLLKKWIAKQNWPESDAQWMTEDWAGEQPMKDVTPGSRRPRLRAVH